MTRPSSPALSPVPSTPARRPVRRYWLLPLLEGTTAVVHRQCCTILGPLGIGSYPLPSALHASVHRGHLRLTYLGRRGTARASQRLRQTLFAGTWAGLRNVMRSVSRGYTQELDIVGRGWRAAYKDGVVYLKTNFSHVVRVPVPPTLEVQVTKQRIALFASSLADLTQWTSRLTQRFARNAYVGKGIGLVGVPHTLKASNKARS